MLVHCYRMLGSIDDAEDAVQETMIRAWRGRDTFVRAVSLRAWLYRIATNVCIDARSRRTRRGESLAEHDGVGPFPDAQLEGAAHGPEARYDTHESISLAFLTVLQVLPPRQRAVLILRDVLDWRAVEVAALLDVSVPAVNSSLHRARSTVARWYRPAGTAAPATQARDPGLLRSLLDRYVRAWESADIAGLVALLRDDAVLSMPPGRSFLGAQEIGAFLAQAVFGGGRTVHLVAVRANGAPAFGVYQRSEPDGPLRAVLLMVVTLDSLVGRVARIDAFVDPRLGRWFDLPGEIAG